MDNESFNQLTTSLDTVNNDPSVPQWAKVLTTCFKTLINQIKGYTEIVNKINDLETNKAVVGGITDNLIAENKRLANELHRLEARIDDNEQRNRNNCLLLHGIEETDNIDTDQIVCDVISKEIGITLSPSDIHRSHRLGPPKSSRNTRSNKVNPRPIIFRFVNLRRDRKYFIRNAS